MKNEPKTCSIPYSHTSYHSSGKTNYDVVGTSGRLNTYDIYNPTNAKGTFERADGATIPINPNKD